MPIFMRIYIDLLILMTLFITILTGFGAFGPVCRRDRIALGVFSILYAVITVMLIGMNQ